ncbi:MAG: SH3 domain-containing protein [Clostridiales bacterium]|nr:SH3 domain-containing protein [Clostridiales bacterium]
MKKSEKNGIKPGKGLIDRIRDARIRRKTGDLEFEIKEKKVRHVEDAASFLKEDYNPEGDYGQPEDMYESWGLDSSQASVRKGKRHIFLRFLIALAVTALLVASVFYILPKILPGFFKGTAIELFVEKEVHEEYDSSYMVVCKTSANINASPVVTSDVITQVLYNEPVKVEEEDSGNGFTYVTTTDGIRGYIKTSCLCKGTDSVEPDKHEYKLVVSENVKNIMTHASQGTLITKVMMNTVLYADVKRDGVYQVSLPGGGTGWIGSSGVIEIDPREEIEQVSVRYFVSSALSLVNSKYLQNGITMDGISINGLVYICSCVNGVPMPRTVQGQRKMGNAVELQYDVVTEELVIDSIIPGDIVFLRSPYGSADSNVVYEMAVCTDKGTLLMVSQAGTTIRLRSFNSRSDICDRIVEVRRVFSQ